MPEMIKPEDTPVVVVHDTLNPQTPYVILDAKGIMHAQFTTREEADAFAETVNAPEPALPQAETSDTAVEHGQEDREQQKEDTMPRGIPKKKTAKKALPKKSAFKKRVATVVKKAAKKVAKKVKAKAKKRAKKFDY